MNVAGPGGSDATLAPRLHSTQRHGDNGSLALVLGGGGARGAYQAGVLRGIARRYPQLRFPILTGISAGAVNTVHLANHTAALEQATEDLIKLWLSLTPEKVFEVKPFPLIQNVLRWGVRLMGGGLAQREPMRGMVNTAPLHRFLLGALNTPDGELPGIQQNIAGGALRAVALSAVSYGTGQSITWVQGRDVEAWERPQRRSHRTRLTVSHIMASSALPILFPAVCVGGDWFGDGGVRMTAPLSPALHLGASHILTISTRKNRTEEEASARTVEGYPPPAQVLGMLYNAVFLDLIDEDILRLNTINKLLEKLPAHERGNLRLVKNLVIRPSRDLGRMARRFEPRLPGFFRYLTRGLGTRNSRTADMLSLILFQEDYLRHLVELGEADAERESGRIEEFLSTAVISAV